MARAGVWERSVLHGHVPEHPTSQAAGAQFCAMDPGEGVEVAPAAGRPVPLLEVLPQERVQRRTVEQIVDPVPVVPLLHDAAPQMAEQLVDILTPLDFPVPSRLSKCPRSCVHPALLAPSLAPQTAEQLVEALTVVSFIDVIRQLVEQIVDIPVPLGGVRLQGFPQNRVQRLRPFLRTFQLVPWMSRFHGFLALFPAEKSAKIGPHSGSELGADFTSSTSSAQLDGCFTDAAGVWMQFPDGWWKLLGSDPEVGRPG